MAGGLLLFVLPVDGRTGTFVLGGVSFVLLVFVFEDTRVKF